MQDKSKAKDQFNLIAFNKVDRVDRENLALAQPKYPKAVFIFIFATQNLGLDTLKKQLLHLLTDQVSQI